MKQATSNNASPGPRIAPPGFNDWPRVRKELRIGDMSAIETDVQRLFHLANETFVALKNGPRYTSFTSSEWANLAFMARVLAREDDFVDAKGRVDKMDPKWRQGIGTTQTHYSEILKLMESGDVKAAEEDLIKLEQSRGLGIEVIILAGMLGKRNLIKRTYDEVVGITNDYSEFSPYVKGIIYGLYGDEASLYHTILEIDAEGIWENGLRVDSTPEENLSICLIWALASGIDLKGIYPKQ
jgi:hypothetical protein